MIEIPLNNVNIAVGDITGQDEEGNTKKGKVLAITVPIRLVIPIDEEAAANVGNALRGVSIQIAQPGDLPATPPGT